MSESTPVEDLSDLVRRWPSILAYPLLEYLRQDDDKMKLWAACDVIELVLRLLVMVGVAELSQEEPTQEGASTRRLPVEVAEQVRKAVERPTLGKWLVMATVFARWMDRPRTQTPELPGYVRGVLQCLLEGPVPAPPGPKPEWSFGELRNRLAHGGGLTSAAARRLRELWVPPFEEAVKEGAWIADLALIVREESGALGRLRGAAPVPEPLDPDEPASRVCADLSPGRLALVRGERSLHLWPLALFIEPRLGDGTDTGLGESPHVYVKREEVQLEYLPIGSDWAGFTEAESPVEEFRRIFRLDQRPAAEFQIRDWRDVLFEESDALRGRRAETDTLLGAIQDARDGAIWVGGEPGIGKSYLMARVAARLLEAPPDETLVLPYRFRGTDRERCNREAFLQFALERIKAWSQSPPPDSQHERVRAPALERLRRALQGVREGCRVILLLDGLDEICQTDPTFAADVPLDLGRSARGALWVCFGRSDRGLPTTFLEAGARLPFPEGLPRMGPDGIREMLLEELGRLRERVLSADREKDGRIANNFIETVRRNSDGLPIYVRFVINDAKGQGVLPAAGALPKSLSRYYEKLIERCEVGALQQVLTPLAATLAVAGEPLSVEELAALLYRRRAFGERAEGPRLVKEGLKAIAPMVRRAPRPDGGEGYTLYHESLRQHLVDSPRMADPVKLACDFMAEAALEPAGDSAERYLYRRGVSHLLETGKHQKAASLLAEFDYLMRRLMSVGDPEGPMGISSDWRLLIERVPGLSPEQQRWEAFWNERAHIVRRGNACWPAHKILLQLAVDHTPDREVMREAQAWIRAGKSDWPRLVRADRPARLGPNPCVRVCDEHKGPVAGLLKWRDRFVSFSDDGTVRWWDLSGQRIQVLPGHDVGVHSVMHVTDRRVASLANDGSWAIWEMDPPRLVYGQREHAARDLLPLGDGRLVAWGEGVVSIWEARDRVRQVMSAEHGRVWRGIVVSPGRFVTQSHRGTVCLWEPPWDRPVVLTTHESNVARALSDGRLVFGPSRDCHIGCWAPGDRGVRRVPLQGTVAENPRSDVKPTSWEWLSGTTIVGWHGLQSFGRDRLLRAWSAESGRLLRHWRGHDSATVGVLRLPHALLSWSGDGTLCLWRSNGTEMARLRRHKAGVDGASFSEEADEILSWGVDGKILLWSRTGMLRGALEGRGRPIDGAWWLSPSRVVSLEGPVLRVWDTDLAKESSGGRGIRALVGALDQTTDTWSQHAWPLEHGRLVTIDNDAHLRVRNVLGELQGELKPFDSGPEAVTKLPSGRFFVSGPRENDEPALVWDPGSGATTQLRAPSGLEGVLPVGQDRLVGWYRDGTFILFDVSSGSEISRSELLHSELNGIWGGLTLEDNRLVTWSGLSPTLRVWSHELEHIVAWVPGDHRDTDNERREIWGVWLLPGGRLVARVRQGEAALWDVDRYERVASLGSCEAVVSLSPREFVAVSPLEGVAVWDSESGQRIWSHALHGVRGLTACRPEVLSSVPGEAVERDRTAVSIAMAAWTWSVVHLLYGDHRGPRQLSLDGPGCIEYAGETPSGRLFAISREGMIRVWDTDRPGGFEDVPAERAPWSAPDVVAAVQAAQRPAQGSRFSPWNGRLSPASSFFRFDWNATPERTHRASVHDLPWREEIVSVLGGDGVTGWSCGTTVGLNLSARDSRGANRVVAWQGDGDLQIELATCEGAVARTRDGHLIFLRLEG